MAGTIESIFVAARPGEAMHALASAELVAGRGIRGDRNFRQGPTDGEPHDQQITFIAAEEIDRFCRETGLSIGAGEPRRNVVTRGVGLHELVGREFRVGAAVVSGVELCEPCATLGRLLATQQVPAAAVVKAFAHRAGLRCRINEGGTIKPGDRVDV